MRAALLLTLSLLAGAAAEARQAPRTITINLCATDVTSHEWSENLSRKVQEIWIAGKLPKDLEILFSSTGELCREKFYGCYSDSKGIFCNEQSINRLLIASAWLAAHDAQQLIRLYRNIPIKQVLEEVGEMDFTAALQIADAFDSEDAGKVGSLIRSYRLTDDLKEFVTDIQKMETVPSYHPAVPGIAIAGPIYDVASSELIAVVLGHEFSHALGGCHLTAPSSVERSGQFQKLLDMQATGAGLIREQPEDDEVRADQCALRALEQVDAAWVADESGSGPSSRSLSRRIHRAGRWIALDAYAALLANSLSGRTGWDPEKHHPGLYTLGPEFELMAVEAEGSEGYLHPSLRLALVAMTLHELQTNDDPSHKLVLCEAAARQFVAMLHIAGRLQNDNKSPEFANLFGTIVAPGVVTGLRTGVWHDKDPGSSYACVQ